jgi:hypothetical protein
MLASGLPTAASSPHTSRAPPEGTTEPAVHAASNETGAYVLSCWGGTTVVSVTRCHASHEPVLTTAQKYQAFGETRARVLAEARYYTRMAVGIARMLREPVPSDAESFVRERRAGVCLTHDEWTGATPIVRSGREIPHALTNFRNPLIDRWVDSSSSGSSGSPDGDSFKIGGALRMASGRRRSPTLRSRRHVRPRSRTPAASSRVRHVG